MPFVLAHRDHPQALTDVQSRVPDGGPPDDGAWNHGDETFADAEANTVSPYPDQDCGPADTAHDLEGECQPQLSVKSSVPLSNERAYREDIVKNPSF